MKQVNQIVFRYFTAADFFNINKASGTEAGGGGQSYIDFPTRSVSVNSWESFFDSSPGVLKSERTQGPLWTFRVNSTGLGSSQELKIYQRRPQSVSIASQKISSLRSNRVYSWHPENGFPMPADPTQRRALPGNLAIYIVRTTDNEYWAGWFMDFSPCKNSETTGYLRNMLINSEGEGYAGMFELPAGKLFFDEGDKAQPFSLIVEEPEPKDAKLIKKKKGLEAGKAKKKTIKRIKKKYIRKVKTEQEIIDDLFSEDETEMDDMPPDRVEITQKVRKRNAKAVKDLKELYQGRCQITGDDLTFRKKDGTFYSEAHHLIPLGNDGADSLFNIVVLSPLIHKMLHYAEVSEINLDDISEDNTLDITINDEQYTITWHPKHAESVRKKTDRDD